VLQVRAAIAHCLRVLDPARLKHDDDVVDRDLVHLLGVQLGTVDIHRSPTFCDALFALHAGDVGGDDSVAKSLNSGVERGDAETCSR
jgi:hypothetical protein